MVVEVLGAAHVLFVAYIIGPNFAPIWAVRIAVLASLIGWAVLIPYFFYVVRFLDPSRVVRRLSGTAVPDATSSQHPRRPQVHTAP